MNSSEVLQESVLRGSLQNPEKPDQTPSESLQLEPKEEDGARAIHGFKWVIVCMSLYLAALIYGLDSTIAADIQSAIIERFDNVERLTWVGTAFPLGSVCAVLPVAALYSSFNLKILFIASLSMFEIGSAVCGAAPNMNALIVGRAIAGIGGSGIFLGTLNYFSLCTTNKERGGYISGIGCSWGLGAVLGPVVGGAFAESSATWRWAFYINLVIAAICAPVYLFYLPPVKPPGAKDTSVLSRLASMDVVGFFGSTAAMVSFVMALTFGGSVWAWSDNRITVTFVVAGVLFIATVLQQYFVLFTTREARMFPAKHILTDRTLLILNILTAVGSMNISIPVYYIPIYCSFVHGDSAIMAAVRLLPYIAFLSVFVMGSGALISFIDYYWTLYLVGGILMTAGSAPMFTVGAETPMANVYGYSILLGAGAGLLVNSGYTVGGIKTTLRTGSGEDVQSVISMLNLSQLGSQLVALLIAGQVFQSLAMANLTGVLNGQGFSQQDIRGAIAGAKSTLFESLTSEMKGSAIDAIMDAIKNVYIISIVAGACAVVSSLLLKRERLFPTAVQDAANADEV